MKRIAAIGVVMGLALVGCVDDDASDGAQEATETPAQVAQGDDGADGTDTTVAEMSEAELEGLLLTLDDLPTGWTQETVEDDDEEPSGAEDTSAAPACFQELETAGGDGPSAEATFVGGASGIPVLNQGITDFGEDAEEVFAEAVAAFDSCEDLSFETEGVLVPGTMRPMSGPDVGDESSAWRMSFDIEGLTLTFDVTMTRVGDVGVLIGLGDLGASDTDLLDEVTTTAVEKVEAGG